MKKGFTLIELLAVIVILAVIALIATPIIINIINDSQKSAATNSAQLYADGLAKQIVVKNMTGIFNPSSCTVTNGNLTCDGQPLEYNVSGKAPTSGTISFTNGVISSYSLCVNEYRIVKNGDTITTTKDATCSNVEPVYTEPGLYRNGVMAYTWQELIDEGLIEVYQSDAIDGETYYNFVYATGPLNGYLYIDDSIEVIDFYAFGSEEIGTGLTGVTIPDSVMYIGNYAFANNSLTSVTIPDSVMYIGNYAFANNSLTSINIPASVVSIYTGAFSNSPFTSITVDPNNPDYDSRDNSNAIIDTEDNFILQGSKNTVIPSTVVEIGREAFKGVGLTSVTIPSTVIDIGSCAFADNPLTSITVDSNNTHYDSRDNSNAIIATANNVLLQGSRNTVIPNTVREIGEYAFYGVGLTSITIPASVFEIGYSAFENNTLTSVTFEIPSGWSIYHDTYSSEAVPENMLSTPQQAAVYINENSTCRLYSGK